MNQPTLENQRRVLTYIEQFYAAHGISPTYREIANEFSWSTDRVFRTIGHLRAAGCISLSQDFARRIVLTNPPPPPVLAPAPTKPPLVSPSARYRCKRCHIKIGAVTGLCEECETGAPLIQYADRMGPERYFQTRRPLRNPYALQYEERTRPTRRRMKQQ